MTDLTPEERDHAFKLSPTMRREIKENALRDRAGKEEPDDDFIELWRLRLRMSGTNCLLLEAALLAAEERERRKDEALRRILAEGENWDESEAARLSKIRREAREALDVSGGGK